MSICQEDLWRFFGCPDPLYSSIIMVYNSVMASPFWNIKDVMEYLQIRSRTTVYKLMKDGFPHARFGKKLIFRQSDVDAWVEEHMVKPKPKK